MSGLSWSDRSRGRQRRCRRPYLWLASEHCSEASLKQREGGRIVTVAAMIAVAASSEGKREIVGLHIGPSEAERFWAAFLKSLAKRSLPRPADAGRPLRDRIDSSAVDGVKRVISDAHEGLKAATGG